MSISKPTLSEIWADTAPSGPTGIEDPGGIKSTGWTGASACPPFSWMNWILNKCDKSVRYLLAKGVPMWDIGETYSIGDRVSFTNMGGEHTYVCVATPTVGTHQPDDGAHWVLWGFRLAELLAMFMALGVHVASTGITPSGGTVSDVLVEGTGTGVTTIKLRLYDMPDSPGSATITFSGARAFATGIKHVQCSPDQSQSDSAIAKILGANQIEVFFPSPSGLGANGAFLTVSGY